jgi:protocatechuate 3,4-dioxygenase beta subunit
MFSRTGLLNRRHLLQGLALGAMSSLASEAFAEALAITPRITEGPFYPDKMPLDTDNDLIIVNNGVTPAVGEITLLSGRVLDPAGKPIRNAFVEIWQVDNNACYLHSGSDNSSQRDSNFQGYGRFLTDAEGRYFFRTIKPVPYPGRPAPHIHFALSKNGRRISTTQLFVKGHPGNERDGIFREIDAEAKKTVQADFKPVENSTLGELAANFEIVLGQTAIELEDGPLKGGIGKPEGGGFGPGRGRPPRPPRDGQGPPRRPQPES